MNAALATRALLFTDMVNSAEHRSRLGEERADELRRVHDEVIGAAVAKHGGTVLRWTGDGVKASFPASSAALTAALAMMRSVRAYTRRSDAIAEFTIRIGLSVGEVSTEDGDEHGVAVIEAARLEALAEPGEILATRQVQQLGERRVDAQFQDVGTRALKGLNDPVEIVRVLDTHSGDSVPMPRALTIDRRFPIVGRATVVDQIAQRWQAACKGDASTLFITGQAGMGKSRVIADAAMQAHDDGALVLAGICDGERPIPYQPFAMALADPALDDEQLSLARAGTGPLAALFPDNRPGRADEQGPAARFELFDAVTGLLQRLSTAQPIVLVLEDLHWATPPTLLLLRHVVQNLADTRLLVLGTYREEEVSANAQLHDLLAEIRGVSRATRIALTTLNESNVASMIASIVPEAPPSHIADLAHRLADESSGNAFFVCELVEHLATTGELQRLTLQGASADSLPIPDSVRDVVGGRLRKLSDDAADLVMTAAAVGLSFELDLIARVADLPVAQALRLVEEIERVALIGEVGAGRYSFSHAIARNTLLARMSATRVALAHRSIAIAIEESGNGYHDELAHHWLQAGDATKAHVRLELAARRDFRALAYESAADKFQQVLTFAEGGNGGTDLEARACLGVALARRSMGAADFLPLAQRAGRLARKLKDVELMADSALATIFPGGFFVVAGVTEPGLVELCEDAIDLLDDTDPRKVRIMATLATHLTFDQQRQRRVDLLSSALELARSNGDPELIGVVLCAEFIALWDPTTATRRSEIGQQVSRMARASGDNDLEFLGGFFSAICTAERGDVADARRRLQQLTDVIAASRNFYFQFLVDRFEVSLNLLAGQPDVQKQIDRLAATYADTHADTAGTWALQTGVLALQEGRLGDLADYLREMMSASKIPASWTAAYGLALLFNGDAEAAGKVLDTFPPQPLDYLWLSTQQAISDLAIGLGRADRCAQLFDGLLPFRGQLGIVSSGSACSGLVSRTLGQLALASNRPALAIELLTEALAHAEAIGAPYEIATTRNALATAQAADS